MKKISAIFILSALVLFGCKSKDKEAPKDKPGDDKPDLAESVLITDTSWGAINKSTDFEGLKTIYGATNVKDTTICGPECADSIKVTMIYPGTPKQVTVYWKENALYHKSIGSLESYMDGSPYHTADSLKIGSPFQKLLDLNGKKIIFNGFDWDYGGYIADYGGGKMEHSKIHFRLGYEGDLDGIMGDSEFNTEMAEVKKEMSKIRISQINLAFPE